MIPYLLRPYGHTHRDEVRSPAKGNRAQFWFAASALTLIIASDFKFRVREPSKAFSGGIDSFVFLELALYGFVGLYLWRRFGRRPRVGRTFFAPVYFVCLFVGLMALSLTYTPYRPYGSVRVAEMAVLLGLVLVAVRHASRGDLHQFAHFYIALIAGSVVYGVLVPSSPVTKLQVGRFTWLAIHPTVSGAMTGYRHGSDRRLSDRGRPPASRHLLASAAATGARSRWSAAVSSARRRAARSSGRWPASSSSCSRCGDGERRCRSSVR